MHVIQLKPEPDEDYEAGSTPVAKDAEYDAAMDKDVGEGTPLKAMHGTPTGFTPQSSQSSPGTPSGAAGSPLVPELAAPEAALEVAFGATHGLSWPPGCAWCLGRVRCRCSRSRRS